MRAGISFIIACALAALVTALPADGQVLIKVNEDVNFKLGVLGQIQADTLDNPEPQPNTNNLFLRRLRLLFGGQVAKKVTFFVETDAPNLGRSLPGGKNIQPSVYVQDAYASFTAADAFTVDAGLMFVPFSRNAIQSAATLLPIDYGAYTFTQSAPTQSVVGRDTGFQARGYLVRKHLEYRVGAFQGFRDARSAGSFRYVGRAQYNFLEPETGFFYTGTYLGKRKIAAVGGAFDRQRDYRAYDGDVFVDYPIGPGAVTARVDFTRFDGGDTLALPKQNDILVEAGYLLAALKITPVLQWQRRDIVGITVGDETRTSVGANYWWASHNANIKAAYTRIAPRGAGDQNEFTIQLQVFYF